MRRETSSSVYDSVAVVTPDQMPGTAAWKKYKDAGKSMVLLMDDSSQPMIHFLPAYMQLNKITAVAHQWRGCFYRRGIRQRQEGGGT